MIPYQSWGSELTPNYQARISLWLYWYMLDVVGILIGIIMPAVLVFGPDCTETPGDGCMQLPIVSFTFCFFVLTLPSLNLVRLLFERPCELSENFYKKKIKDEIFCSFPSDETVPGFIQSMMNEPFRIFVIADSVEALADNMPYILIPYWCKWVIGEDSMEAAEAFTIGAVIRLVTQVCGIPFWFNLAKRPGWGKMRTFMVGTLMLSAVSLPTYIFTF